MTLQSVLSDVAVTTANRDLLKFDRYVKPIVSIIMNPKTETPFTVGIFGAWGSGKSTLLALVDERLKSDHPDAVIRVHFNPWMHRNEPNMLVPLLHALHDALESDRRQRFLESAKKIGNVLVKLAADVLLKSMTVDAVSLEQLEKLEQDYFNQKGKVESEMRRLRTTLQQEANAIAQKNARIVLFIDDLDRCEPAAIIDLLEAVKLFFDLEHVVVLLAVDKEVVDRGIEVKYSKFRFAEGRAAVIGAEYLEKLVQLPLQLFPLDRAQVAAFIAALNPNQAALEQIAELQQLVVPNPRKIKRILNILSVTQSIAKATPGLEALDFDVITRLILLQVQSSDLYSEVTRHPDLLTVLERCYARELNVNDAKAFLEFRDRRQHVQQFCLKYYRPETYLNSLFENAGFGKLGATLPMYLTMLGG